MLRTTFSVFKLKCVNITKITITDFCFNSLSFKISVHLNNYTIIFNLTL